MRARMSRINQVIRTKHFEKSIKSVKDKKLLEKAKKQIKKIIESPSTGKPLRYGLKGERTIYIKPFRLIYAVKGDKLFLLRFMHRKKVYK